MRESDIKQITEMIERRNKLIRQIGKLRDSLPLKVGDKRIAAQLHFSSDSIHIGLTQEIFDLIITDMVNQAEYVNNQLKEMGITTLDEELAAKGYTLAKRTSVPVTKIGDPYPDVDPAPAPIIPSVFVDQEDKFEPKIPGQSGITTGKKVPRHPDDDFGGEA